MAAKCKKCVSLKTQVWRQKNLSRAKKAIKDWHKQHPERVREIARAGYHRNLEKERSRSRAKRTTEKGRKQANERQSRYKVRNKWKLLARRYNTSEEFLKGLMRAQKKSCLVCNRDIKDRFHVDHDHACCRHTKGCCGKCIRGLLCGPCNMGLGVFKDSPELLLKAVRYLENWKLKKQESNGKP